MDVNDDRLGGNVISIRRESFMESFGIQEVEEDAGAGRRNSLSVDDLEDGALDASEDDRRHSSSRGESHGSSSSRAAPPNFAGGHARRKGDRSHRVRKKFSFGLDAEENRRASTGTMSVQESFGDMSLQSFTSASSFTSSAGDNNKNVALGNLIFVTDEEMAQLMYGKEKDVGGTEKSMDSSDGPSLVPRRSSDMSTGSGLSASLPPSATLGTGAFSTVRLAWRRTPDQTIKQSAIDADGEPSTSFQEVNEDHTVRERRSVVRVQSNQSDADPCAPFKHKGQLVAVKIIQKSILKQMKSMQRGPDNRMTVQTAFDNIEREIATMKRLRHPNLVRLYEVIDSVESDRLHMVLEYVSLGEILSHVEGTNRYTRMRYKRKVRGLTEDGHFDEKYAALYFVDILHGLAYLHRNRICHRDLKPENILLCHSGIAKISDFGVAHMFEDEQDRESYMMSALEEEDLDGLMSDYDGVDDSARSDGQIHLSKHESDVAYNMSSRHDRGMLKKTEGTWCFWSPEMCDDDSKGFSGYSSDLWAAGVCLYIFTTGKLPFFSMMPSELFELIAKAQVRYKGLVMSDELKDLLDKLLRKDPSTRAGVGDCLKHEFCADARAERLGELDNKFRKSEEHIILSKNDVAMALSVTMPNKKKHGVFRKAASKRLSAPEIMVSSASQPITAAKLKKDSNLTVLTEASAEEKGGHKVPDNSAYSPGLASKNSFKRVGLASKFKLKKWWHRRRDS